MDFGYEFQQALSYDDFLDQNATAKERERWDGFHRAVKLGSDQVTLLESFRRQQRVLCLAGSWCGDCVEQCPIFDHFQRANPLIEVRYQDRDYDLALQEALRMCGGARVPAVVFLSEDNLVVGRYGDRTLSKYRYMVAGLSGPACPSGLLPQADLTAAVIRDWLNEFERIQWILRTSPRLREKHGD